MGIGAVGDLGLGVGGACGPELLARGAVEAKEFAFSTLTGLGDEDLLRPNDGRGVAWGGEGAGPSEVVGGTPFRGQLGFIANAVVVWATPGRPVCGLGDADRNEGKGGDRDKFHRGAEG